MPLANARLELARTVAFAAGPALGGALVGFAGPGPAFALVASLSFAAALLLTRIHEPAPVASARRPIEDIREGTAFVLRHSLLAPIFVTQTVFNTGMFMILAVFVPHAVARLGLSAGAIGLVLGASAWWPARSSRRERWPFCGSVS